MKTELEKKIEQLKREEALKEEAKTKLPNIKHNALFVGVGNKTKLISIDLEGETIAKDIKTIVKAFKPTVNEVLTFAAEDGKKTKSPFALRFKNNAAYGRKAKITYTAGEFEIWIELPEGFYTQEVREHYMRTLSDCEYHYFIGVPMNELRKKQINAYKLKGFPCVKYYGGEAACYLDDKTKKKEFERIVLTGK